MPYSIETKDGIIVPNIPDDVDPNSQELKDLVAKIRAERTQNAPEVKEPPTNERGIMEQLYSGARKRAEETAMGLKGVGLRAGSALGITDPETMKQYQQEVARGKTLMETMTGPGGETTGEYMKYAPTSGAEVFGGLGVDLATMYGAGFGLKPLQYMARSAPVIGGALEKGIEYTSQALTSPRTVPQAALGGGLYSQTYPFETGREAAGSALWSAGAGGLTLPVTRALGLSPQTESNLTDAQKQAAKRAVEAGFQFTPAQMSGSKTSMFIEEGIKALPLARGAYSKLEDENQSTLQKIAAKAIGLKEGASFTPESMQEAYTNALNKYKVLTSVPSLKLDKGFVDQLSSLEKKLAKIPESQRAELDVPKVEALIKDYKNFNKNAVDGETMFESLRALRSQLFKAQKEGTYGAGAYKDISSYLENAIERALQNPSKKNVVSSDVIKKFKDGRTQMANWFTVDEAFNAATGEISGPKLAASLARKSNFGGRNTELETAALAVRAFPKALPSSGTAERAEAAGAVKQAAQALTLPTFGAGVAGTLTQDPYTAAMGAAASQMLPALAAKVGTSEPVRSVVARRQLGAIAPDEGLMARAFREMETRTPAAVRFGAGDLARLYAQQKSLLD